MLSLNQRFGEIAGDIAARIKRDKICPQPLESEKYFSKVLSRNKQIFFAPDPTTSSQKNIVPIALQNALNNSYMLKNCITKGYVRMEELIEI